jgi:alkylation response protein AidB-like acyl-CoA dehydrogenase
MAFIAKPLFAGDLYDAAWRLASEARAGAGSGGVAREEKRLPSASQASALWRHALELGWQGVIVPEAMGGVGAALPDLVALVEATARGACTIPVVDRCGVAPALLTAAAAFSRDAQFESWLAQVAASDASVCPVLDGDRGVPGAATGVTIDSSGLLSGHLSGADLTEPASHLLFRARREGQGPSAVVLLSADAVAGALQWHAGIDDRRVADIDLAGVLAPPECVLLVGEEADRAVSAARRVGTVLGCAHAVGALGAIIELTIEYLNTRSQFDVRLSSFQALRHRVVEMYVAYENLCGLVRRVASETAVGDSLGDDGAGFTTEIAMLKLYAATVSRQVAEGAIQLHGGMGMTLELEAPRLAMSVLASSLDHGERGECLDWLVARAQADAMAA